MGKNRISNARCVDRPVSFDLGHFLVALGKCFPDGVFKSSVDEHLSPYFAKGFPSWLRGHYQQHDGAGVPVGYPEADISAAEVSINLLARSLLSKYCDSSKADAELRAAAAFSKWKEAEEQCRITNERFRGSGRLELERSGVNGVLHLASRKIARLLGEFSWDEAYDGFAFGPGATTRLGRRSCAYANKFSGQPEATLDCFALAEMAIRLSPRWYESSLDESGNCVSIRNFNKVVTVPKDRFTDRVISIEPDMNMYIQKGIGKMIRRRLKRVGVDLDDQRINQTLAYRASIGEDLVTIDLSSASDTVSYEIVFDLLPLPWATALEQCRSSSGVLPSGELITYQKFSSMGNGYTFELESLIFWALSAACIEATHGLLEKPLGIYGDDIVIDVKSAKMLIHVLEVCGFSPNLKKTWTEPYIPYRESCGKHFFDGLDVTPFFLRRPVKTMTDLFLLHNNLWRWAVRQQWNPLWDRKAFRELITALRSRAPSKWRKPRIPDGFGDGAFIGTFDEACPSKAPKGWDGWVTTSVTDVSTTTGKTGWGAVLSDLAMRGKEEIVIRCESPCRFTGMVLEFSAEPFSGYRTDSRKRVKNSFFIPRSADWGFDPFES